MNTNIEPSVVQKDGMKLYNNTELHTNNLNYIFSDFISKLDMSSILTRKVSSLGRYNGVKVASALVAGKSIHINPSRTTGRYGVMSDFSSAEIPNSVQAEGFDYGQGILTHAYIVITLAPIKLNGVDGLRAIEKSLLMNPTPGRAVAASVKGTRNDVGNLAPGDGDDNFVKSFVVPSNHQNRTLSVINYTIDGEHFLDEGFVLRFGKMVENNRIALVSYGEGDAMIQSNATGFLWRHEVQKVWTENANKIFREALI